MVSLVDLLDAEDVAVEVPIRGKGITCRGLNAHDIAMIMLEFPDVRAMMAERRVDPVSLMQMAPDAIVTVIAMGSSRVGDDLEIPKKVAQILTLEEQLALFEKIIELSSPDGLIPFITRVARVTGLRPPTLPAGAVDGPGRDQDGKSPSPLNGSSPPGTEKTMSGDTPSDSSGSTASSSTDEKSETGLAA